MRKPLLAFLFFLLSITPAHAAGLIDYSKTPWGTGCEAVIQKLGLKPANYIKNTNGGVINLVVNIGNLKASGKEYILYGTFMFDNKDELFQTGLKPITIEGENLPLNEVTPLYKALVSFHTEQYGQPQENDNACPDAPMCRRTRWHLASGEDILSVMEVTDPQEPAVAVILLNKPRTDVVVPPTAKPYSPALKGKDVAFLAGVQKRIDGRHGDVKIEPIADFELDVTEAKDEIKASYRLRRAPLSLAAAKEDAREVALFMVQELLAQGINPGTEKIYVYLWLELGETGVTGKKLTRLYGSWGYYPPTDSLEWQDVK